MPIMVSSAPAIYREVTLTSDTAQYAAGDVLNATQEITGICKAGHPVSLWSLALLDKDDQGAALDIYFMRTNASIGTENAAAAITDAVADEIQTVVSIAASDYTDLGSSQFAIKNANDDGMGVVLFPDGGESLFIATETGGTPTYTANGLTLKLAFVPF